MTRMHTYMAKECVSPESYYIKVLFEQFEARRIRYAVLRNYEDLPFSSGGSDLDILVHPEDSETAKNAVFSAIAESRGVPVGYSEITGFLKVFVLGSFFRETKKLSWWGLRIDISFELFFAGAVNLLNWSGDLKKAHNGIFVLPDHLSDVLGVLKEVLHNNRLPKRYIEGARVAARTHWQELAGLLSPMGSRALMLFRQLLLVTSAPSELAGQCGAIRNALRSHAVRRAPLSYFVRRFRFEWSKVRRYLEPSGAVIAILGVDGAGKSTVINSIKPVLDEATHNATCVFHLRPGLLPPLARLKGRAKAQVGPVLDPHGSPPSGWLGSLLRLIWLSLDYSLGYWLLIRPKIAKEPAIVIFDRYAYDMALDPRRFRIGLPGRVAALFARFAPRPDLIICLHAKPEVIAARKRELSMEEIERQLEALRAFAKIQQNAILVSTEGAVEDTRNTILNIMKTFFSNRWKG